LTAFSTTRSEAVFPVLSDAGDVVGTIDVESNRLGAFSSDDEQFLTRCAEVIQPLWKSALGKDT
jgi:putative methionine-R-sulfoxide reductase with GAF domain